MLGRASLCFLFLSGVSAAIAADVEVQESAEIVITPNFTATGYLGYLNGESGEYVYGDAGEKVSQLDWKIDNALIIGGDLSYRATDWLSLRAGGWTTLASGNTMDDRDWLLGYNGFDSWTHWSHHPNTDTSKAFQIDVSAAAKFAEYNNLQFSALAGYRFKNMKWDASDGTFIYSSADDNGNIVGFRDQTETFHGPVIGYEQWWHTPYIGLGVTYEAPRFRLTGEIIGSPFVMSRDRDHHYLRNLIFTESFDTTQMIGVSLSAERDLGAAWTVFGRADYQNYFEARGDTRTYDTSTGEVSETRNSAGLDHYSFAVMVGLGRKF